MWLTTGARTRDVRRLHAVNNAPLLLGTMADVSFLKNDVNLPAHIFTSLIANHANYVTTPRHSHAHSYNFRGTLGRHHAIFRADARNQRADA